MGGAVFFAGNNMIRNTFLFGKGGHIHQVPKRVIRCKLNKCDIYHLYAFSFWEDVAQEYCNDKMTNKNYIIAPVTDKRITRDTIMGDECPIDGGIWIYSSTINRRLAKLASRLIKISSRG